MKLIAFDFKIKHRSKKINFVDEFLKRSNYENVNTKIQRLFFILQHKLIMFENIKKKIVNLNVIYVKKLQNFFLSIMLQTIVFVYTINAMMTSRQNQTINSMKNKIENYIFILFDKSIKSKRVILINNRIKQYVSRIVITALFVDENSYEKNSKNIFKFIKTLQIFDTSTQRNRIEILTTYA